MNRNRHIIIQYGIDFAAVFLIMTAVVGVLVHKGLYLEALGSETEAAYEWSFAGAQTISEMESYPFLVRYWQEHLSEMNRLTDDETDALKDSVRKTAKPYDLASMSQDEQKEVALYYYQIILREFEMISSGEDATLSGPMVIGVSEDGSKTILIDPDDRLFKEGDRILLEEDGTLHRSGKYDLSHAGDNLVHIPTRDGSYPAVAYPVVSGDDTVAIVVTGISEDILLNRSRSITNRIIAATVTIALISGIILLILIYAKIIKPVLKIHSGLEKYTHDFNTDGLVEQMGQVRSKNEIGRLAGQIGDLAVKLRRYSEEKTALISEKAKLDSEIELASQIQRSILPTHFPDRDSEKRFDIYASMDPARVVGGDLYDFFFIDDDHLALLIADVAGKGIPASLFEMEAKTMIGDKAVSGKTPAGILTEVNAELIRNNNEQLFITTWLMIIELSTGKALEANAGHVKPAYSRAGGPFELVSNTHSLALAALDEITIEDHQWTLQRGDKIFVYTDGVTEAEGDDGELFGSKRMLEALNEVTDKEQKDILIHVKERVGSFVGEKPQSDDLTMLGFTFYGS